MENAFGKRAVPDKEDLEARAASHSSEGAAATDAGKFMSLLPFFQAHLSTKVLILLVEF